MNDDIARALEWDCTIDIITMRRKTGRPRRTEIWFHNIEGRIIITGTPGPRGWLANLAANPEFTLHLKGAVRADLPARARLITDSAERRAIMAAPETGWYRGQVDSIDRLVEGSPMVEVVFTD